KVAIARTGQIVLSAVQRPSARAVIARHCREVGAQLRVVAPLRSRRASPGEVTGRLATGARFAGPLGLATLLERVGAHQRQNAALAVAAADVLSEHGLPLSAVAVEA